MKQLLFLVSFIFISPFSFAEVEEPKKVEPEKFKVTYTIVYKEMTLQEAADREILIRQREKEACSIKTEVDEKGQDFIFTNYGEEWGDIQID
jgi:hypothetical protein